ncbi:helix-turn-helix domain-containing protein [Salisediminibacterium beveridgei]|uniref:helix-turn-helix domain-containing protein n=1 Tax=Salisediminibacterium beveridgei TaxID=632773 RepID=UPI000A079538|nr:helix-turn-helix domain-containing protein [Salisediminibacterium beveridgei]
MKRKTLTVKEISAILGIGINQTYQLVNQGIIPNKRLGNRIIIPEKSFYGKRQK